MTSLYYAVHQYGEYWRVAQAKGLHLYADVSSLERIGIRNVQPLYCSSGDLQQVL